MVIFELKDVKKRVSDRLTLEIEHLKINTGERIGIVGLNGAGKTTLLKIMLGELEVDSGHVIRRAKNVGWIKQTTQKPNIHRPEDSWLQKERQRQRSLWKINDVAPLTMSGGETTRLQIAEVLAAMPDVLAADEPTTHLDIDAIQHLSDELSKFAGTLLLISHDRDLLDQHCDHMIEVEDGKVKRYTGNYRQYTIAKEHEKQQAEAAYEQYIEEKSRLERAIMELRGASSKMTKAPKRMGNSEARLHKGGIRQRRAKVERNFKVLEARLERLEVKQKPISREPVRFDQGGFPELRGRWALRLNDFSLTVGERKLIDSLSCFIRPGMKVAMIGPNGAGKTSLLDAIYAEYEKESSVRREDIHIPKSARLGYFHQKLDHLNMDQSLFANIRAVSSYPDSLIRTVLARLHFKRDEVLKPAAVLSGGEKVKAGLAIVFLSEANLLLLDEPTNYLDVFTQEELQEMVMAYPGTVLFASHDRQFIQAIADHVIELDPQKRSAKFYPLEDGAEMFQRDDNSSQSVQREQTKGNREGVAKKRSDELTEEKLILETELTAVLSKISSAQPGEDLEALEKRYEELLARLKALRS